MKEAGVRKYLAKDYADALKFYDDRARSSKWMYRACSIYLIVASAILTPLVAFAPEGGWRIVAAVLSATLVIATGLLAHLKCHENWLSYRASWDALRRERRLFENASGPYRFDPDKPRLFVERVEAVLMKEGSEFFARHAIDKKGDAKADKVDPE